MAKAQIEKEITFKGYEDVEAGIVKWPMSVIRIKSADRDKLNDLADKILLAWRGYTDEEAFIFAETDGEPHNTITPIEDAVTETMSLTLCSETTSQQRSIRLAYIIRMPTFIT